MRPALQRLFNRPRSIIILETLLRPSSSPSSLPIGLQDNGTCPRCNRGEIHTNLDSSLRQLRNKRERTLKNDYYGPSSDAGSRTSRVLARYCQRRGIATSAPLRTENKKLSYEELLLESDVGHQDKIGSRLIDVPEHQEDFALWLQLLQFRQQKYNDTGVLDIWRGMMIRCEELELPVEGYIADEIWGIFARHGIVDKDFLRTLFKYAQRLWKDKGKRWPKLHSTIVGGILEKQPRWAWHWHILLRDDHFQSPRDVRLLFPWNTKNPRVDRTFEHIYKSLTSPRIYSDIIPRLCKAKRFQEALRWHDVFLRKKDLPALEEVIPLVQYLQWIGDTNRADEMIRNLSAAGLPLEPATMMQLKPDQVFTPQSEQDYEQAPAPKTDEFCARLFATSAFPFSFVLIGLQLFNVKAIGPISIRELAIAAGTPEVIENRLRQLKEANIDIGHSAFVRLVQKLARANDTLVLQDVLKSDQHPDVFEDLVLQERMLRRYHNLQDGRQVQKTVAILTLDSDSEEAVWNLRLRLALARSNNWSRFRQDIARTLEGMIENRIMVTPATVRYMYFNLLTERERGEPDTRRVPDFDGLGWLISLWQGMLRSNIAEIRAHHWQDVIKRLGMAQRWDDLQTLLLWLAAWYAPSGPDTHHNPPIVPTPGRTLPVRVAPFDKRYEFKEMLHFGLQRALVEWGFIHPHRPSLSPFITTTFPRPSSTFPGSKSFFRFRAPQPLMPWTRGLVLLKRLALHGIHADTDSIRHVCRQHLRYFFGDLDALIMSRPKPSFRSRAKAKNRLRTQRTNQWSLEEFLADAETVWPGLFAEFEGGGEEQNWRMVLCSPKPSRYTVRWMVRRLVSMRSRRDALRHSSGSRDASTTGEL